MTDADRFASAFDVSRETLDKLTHYTTLLAKWNPAINLVSKTTLPEIWTRHLADSAQVFNLANTKTGIWLDMGSGGGFPGMVIAILAAEKAPGLAVTCVESDRRKATFLNTVARETGTKVQVLAERIETLPPQCADIVSARALAPLPALIAYAAPHLALDGTALFLKGTGHQAEIDEALAHWSFDLDTTPSRTDPGSTILQLRRIRRA